MKSRSFRTLLVLSLAGVLAACGGATSGRTTAGARRGPSELDRLRAEAAAHPDVADTQRKLAEWELFGPGGDVAKGEVALHRAIELAPTDLRLAYAHAILADLHARPDEALDAYLAVLDRAPASSDPLAPLMTEAALGSLEGLRTDASSFTTRLRPVLERLVANSGHAGLPARRQAVFWLRDLAQERGDVATADALERASSCPRSLRVAGPFGPAVVSSFDATLPAEGPGPLADRYDLGPGRGMTDTRTVEARSCSASLGGGRFDGAGSRIVESILHVDEGGRFVLALAAGGSSAQIRVDDALVARIDRRRHMISPVSFHTLELAAGDHVLELKLTSRFDSPVIGFMLDRVGAGADPTAGVRIPDATDPLGTYLAIEVLSLRGDPLEARERLLAIDLEQAPAAMLVLAARVVDDDPYRPDTDRADDERNLVALAQTRDPNAMWPAVRAAELETNDTDRLAALRAVAARFPAIASLELVLADELSESGHEALAEQALERAAAARPDACAVLMARFDALLDRGRVEAANALVDSLIACDARSGTRFNRAVARHDWAAARQELERLHPTLTSQRIRELDLMLARGSGDAASELRLEAAIEADGAPGQHLLAAVDRRYVASDARGAAALVAAESARAPKEASDLRRLMYALSGEDVTQPYRVDGLEVIRRFQASGRTYDGYAAVLVFDYMVTRVFEDGSAIDLVHQIHRLQTTEGVEAFTSLNVPGRALTVRAVSPDGRVREPDSIGQGAISMPPLAVGDYVEYEYVRDEAPSWGDAYLSNGWIFQNFSQPFDHSEMVYVAPVSMELSFDTRGPVPAPEVRVENGLRVTRFVVNESRALTEEVHATSEPSVLPHLRASVRATWERMYEAVRDRLADADPIDPGAERLLRDEILGRTELPKAERARKIHRWVMDHVEQANNSFFGSAPEMLGAREGSRLRLIRYLLELSGVSTQVAFVASIDAETPNPRVPNSSDYDNLVLVADVGGTTPLFLVGADRDVAYDYLPPGLRGQDAILIAEGLPHIRLPASQGAPDTQRIEGELEVDERGRAAMRMVLTVTGASAAELRGALRTIAASELDTVLAERFVPSIIPGGIGDPSSIVLGGMDDWESPLSIGFVAVSDGLARFARDGMYLTPLMQSGIERAFAGLPTRTTTELVGELDVALALRIRGPGVGRAPTDQQLRGPSGASASLTATRAPDGEIKIERRVRLPIALVRVADYAGFARFCREVTQLEERPVVFAPR